MKWFCLIFIFLAFIQCSKPRGNTVLVPVAVSNAEPAEPAASSFHGSLDSLFLKYQNYDTNNLAKESLIEGLATLGDSYVGKSAPLQGIVFSFHKIITNPQTGAVSALFSSSNLSEPSISDGEYATIGEPLVVGALGILPKEEALKLSDRGSYLLSGNVHAFDSNDLFNLSYGSAPFCGMFILDDMVVSKLK